MFKYLTNCVDFQSLFQDYFSSNLQFHNYLTRRRQELRPGVFKTKIGLHSIKVQGPRIWNSLPIHIKQSQSFDIFKYACKKHHIGILPSD